MRSRLDRAPPSGRAVTLRLCVTLGALDLLFAAVASWAYGVVVAGMMPDASPKVLGAAVVAHGSKLLLWVSYSFFVLRPLEEWWRGESGTELGRAIRIAFRFPVRLASIFSLAWGASYVVQAAILAAKVGAPLAVFWPANVLVVLAVVLAAFPFALLVAEHVALPVRAAISRVAQDQAVPIAERGLSFRTRIYLLVLCLTMAPTVWLLALGMAIAPDRLAESLPAVPAFVLAILLWAPMIAWLLGSTVGRPIAAIAEAVDQLGRIPDVAGIPAVPVLYDDEIGKMAGGLQRSMRRLVGALDEAQAAVRLREDFLTVASHELRNPLSALQLQVEALLLVASRTEDRFPPRLSEGLERVQRQVGRLAKLIERLLDVTRMEGGVRLSREPVDLALLLRRAVEREDEMFERAECPVEVEIEEGLTGWWDPLRIEQVIDNLLSNAAKYGAGRRVEVRAWGEARVALFQVRDEGMGIAPEDRERIFGKFERAVDTRLFGGLGMGLYVCRLIVEAHGGSIDVESEPGAGATFTVSLPRATAAAS